MSRDIHPEGSQIHINLAKLKKGGNTFEIDVDPTLALNLKKGLNVDIRDVLKVENIFKDAKKGLIASEHVMEEVFGTTDVLEVAKVIIKEGEIQVTSEYRKEQKEKKIKRIVELIHKNTVDPTTHLPHPVQRIQNAMDEAKVRINDSKTAEEQVDDITKKLRPIIPIKTEQKEIQIHVGPHFAGQCHNLIKSFGKEIKSDWQNDGSLLAVIEIPGGLELDLYDKLNKITKGDIEIKLLKIK